MAMPSALASTDTDSMGIWASRFALGYTCFKCGRPMHCRTTALTMAMVAVGTRRKTTHGLLCVRVTRPVLMNSNTNGAR
jgi:hypothetical protein